MVTELCCVSIPSKSAMPLPGYSPLGPRVNGAGPHLTLIVAQVLHASCPNL